MVATTGVWPSGDGRRDTASHHRRRSGSSEFLNPQNRSRHAYGHECRLLRGRVLYQRAQGAIRRRPIPSAADGLRWGFDSGKILTTLVVRVCYAIWASVKSPASK